MAVFPAAAGVSVDESGTTVHIAINPDLYPEDVALRAAYWVADRGYVHVTKNSDNGLVAEIRLKDGCGGDGLTNLCGEFCNALVDFALRARIAVETQDIQEALLTRAFVELLPKPQSGN